MRRDATDRHPTSLAACPEIHYARRLAAIIHLPDGSNAVSKISLKKS
jgi:hypothetical protein